MVSVFLDGAITHEGHARCAYSAIPGDHLMIPVATNDVLELP